MRPGPLSFEELARSAHFNAREFAGLCRLSPRQVQRIFRAKFTLSPQQWLNEKRISVARELLLSGKPVKVVAYELGFKQSSHFCRQFKAVIHMTPSEFVSKNPLDNVA
jgi:AraC-like DNA-binding protein